MDEICLAWTLNSDEFKYDSILKIIHGSDFDIPLGENTRYNGV